jgi:hypothetical protein
MFLYFERSQSAGSIFRIQNSEARINQGMVAVCKNDIFPIHSEFWLLNSFFSKLLTDSGITKKNAEKIICCREIHDLPVMALAASMTASENVGWL